MYNIKGFGTRVVGSSVENYKPGDFVLVGSNTPHVWKSAKEHYQDNSLKAECLVLFIPCALPLFELNELVPIKQMLEVSTRGIRFKSDRQLNKIMWDIHESKGILRINRVLNLLQKMVETEYKQFLTPPNDDNEVQSRDFDRLSKCIEFLLQNFDQKIELKEVAELANMTTNSFCRYFKKRTAKTFSQYLIGLRITKATRLLLETDLSIQHIAFESGFNNLSNFNEQFKAAKQVSPRSYRKKGNKWVY
ncbi:MAG: AraC family transcriptional regulator [Bacteroidota bacterium]